MNGWMRQKLPFTSQVRPGFSIPVRTCLWIAKKERKKREEQKRIEDQNTEMNIFFEKKLKSEEEIHYGTLVHVMCGYQVTKEK